MKALVTGATGFAGRWLTRELTSAGHEVIGTPSSVELDIGDERAVREFVTSHRPDAIVHLAAIASGARIAEDPAAAVRTNIGGTISVTEAAGALDVRPALVMISSAEVYRPPAANGPPLTELDPVGSRHPYGLSKLAQETIALSAADRHRLPLAILRPFNHVGPGQRPASAVASFAQRIVAVRDGRADKVSVGNLDIERDIGDVRDHVVAYRLVLEALVEGRFGAGPVILNVATGVAVSLRSIVERMCGLAGIEPELRVMAELVRSDDPPRLVGDAGALRGATGWTPRIDLDQTLADVLQDQVGAVTRSAV